MLCRLGSPNEVECEHYGDLESVMGSDPLPMTNPRNETQGDSGRHLRLSIVACENGPSVGSLKRRSMDRIVPSLPRNAQLVRGAKLQSLHRYGYVSSTNPRSQNENFD